VQPHARVADIRGMDRAPARGGGRSRAGWAGHDSGQVEVSPARLGSSQSVSRRARASAGGVRRSRARQRSAVDATYVGEQLAGLPRIDVVPTFDDVATSGARRPMLSRLCRQLFGFIGVVKSVVEERTLAAS
jgi:hypothetical protein